uniref:Shikimate kinase n=1 Tax=uncultured Spirochaetaceae bacterium TaxID=201186 RepID=A0A650ENU2_9SPIO|nr:hypothetical protein Unknown280_1610 [uncultured Spirochaetaceae bacterium]
MEKMKTKIFECALIFVGIKHCGKSTQGKRIASHLGLEFFDTDDLIQKYEGISPREIYTKFGKEKFMEAEKNACQKLAEFFETQNQKYEIENCAEVDSVETVCRASENSEQNAQCGLCKKNAFVAATGGGICENKNAIEILKTFGTIIFLQTNEKTAADRIVREADFSTTPARNLPAYIAEKNPRTEKETREIFHDFFMRRTNRYKKIADVIVQMENASKEINTEKILAALGMKC